MNKKALVKKFEKLIDEKFEKQPINKRTALFVMLEEWAKKELDEECCEIFLEALYGAKATKDCQFCLSVGNALAKITKK